MNTLRPGPQGLYLPQYEHDACGVGAICHLKGEKSHYIIEKALEILVNLTHRGACGCDPLTGDGAGILLQMPDKFLRKKAAEQGIDLPPDGQYAAGHAGKIQGIPSVSGPLERIRSDIPCDIRNQAGRYSLG